MTEEIEDKPGRFRSHSVFPHSGTAQDEYPIIIVGGFASITKSEELAMKVHVLFGSCAIAAVLASSSAFAVTTDREGVTRHHAYRHHVARNHNPGIVSDVPQESAAPDVKPQTEPEYFGHAAGSDGSMPQ